MHEDVVSGLGRELALEADTVRAQYEALLADVAALDRSILLFNPDTDIAVIVQLLFTRTDDWAKRGAIARAILSALRGASEPLSAFDIVAPLRDDRSLSRQRDNGAVESRAPSGGQYLEWVIGS